MADGVGSEPGVHAYEPFRQLPDFFLEGGNQFGHDLKVAILADEQPRALATLVRQEIAKLDRELAIESLEPMDDQVRESSAPQRVSTWLVGAFAAIALLLASVGLYGLLAYTTAQRGKEIAVRMALGAERRAVVRMVIGQGARLVAIGLAAGLVSALFLSGRGLAPLPTNVRSSRLPLSPPCSPRPGSWPVLLRVARRARRACHSFARIAERTVMNRRHFVISTVGWAVALSIPRGLQLRNQRSSPTWPRLRTANS